MHRFFWFSSTSPGVFFFSSRLSSFLAAESSVPRRQQLQAGDGEWLSEQRWGTTGDPEPGIPACRQGIRKTDTCRLIQGPVNSDARLVSVFFSFSTPPNIRELNRCQKKKKNLTVNCAELPRGRSTRLTSLTCSMGSYGQSHLHLRRSINVYNSKW